MTAISFAPRPQLTWPQKVGKICSIPGDPDGLQRMITIFINYVMFRGMHQATSPALAGLVTKLSQVDTHVGVMGIFGAAQYMRTGFRHDIKANPYKAVGMLSFTIAGSCGAVQFLDQLKILNLASIASAMGSVVLVTVGRVTAIAGNLCMSAHILFCIIRGNGEDADYFFLTSHMANAALGITMMTGGAALPILIFLGTTSGMMGIAGMLIKV